MSILRGSFKTFGNPKRNNLLIFDSRRSLRDRGVRKRNVCGANGDYPALVLKNQQAGKRGTLPSRRVFQSLAHASGYHLLASSRFETGSSHSADNRIHGLDPDFSDPRLHRKLAKQHRSGSRRRFLAATLVGGLTGSWPPAPVFSQENGKSAADSQGLITPETKRAIRAGLDFLVTRQDPKEGFFGRGPYARNVGVCSLAGLAFLSNGSTPGRGPYGKSLRLTVQYILGQCQKNGFITSEGYQSHGPMYGHGFATLLLAEAYGMTFDQDVLSKLNQAVRLIIDTQNSDGGWRYRPQRSEADISVTICQIMALRAAKNAGIYVPNETVERCIDYVKRSQNPDGGFMYMMSDGSPSEFPRSAAGVVALYSAGIYQGEEIEKGLEFIYQFRPRGRMPGLESYFFYGHYYAIQAMWHAGGTRWRTWYSDIRDLLVRLQNGDGHWMASISSEYGTAMACIILQMPNNYLPIFQR